jgi:pimeloyl-ACP methyl ester carboxylesterase
MGAVRTSAAGLAFTTTGPADATTCLLLHGVGTTGWMWRQLTDDLSVDLHVGVVDLPGHGASAAVPWRSLADTTSIIADLVAEEGHGGQADLVGLSLGGYLALELAADRPDLVPSATVSGVNVLPFPRARLMRLAGRALAPVMTSGAMLRANARALAVPPEDYDGYAAAARSMAPGTFVAVGEELMSYTVPARAATSSTRVLALAGSEEQPLIRRSSAVIAASYPHAAARIAPAGGHAWNGQHPELFAATVRAQVAGEPLPEALVTPTSPDTGSQRADR